MCAVKDDWTADDDTLLADRGAGSADRETGESAVLTVLLCGELDGVDFDVLEAAGDDLVVAVRVESAERLVVVNEWEYTPERFVVVIAAELVTVDLEVDAGVNAIEEGDR